MAAHFGERDLSKFLASISHRQLSVWLKWFDNQWNKPNRTDHYLMQLSSDIANLFSSEYVPVMHRKLTWSIAKPIDPEAKKQADLAYQASILAAVGAI